jgi:hypothetical protein
MNTIVVSCILVCGLSGGPALAKDINLTVPAGRTTFVNIERSWDRDCVSNGGIVKVLTKPQNGRITNRTVNSAIVHSRFSPVGSCFGKAIKGFAIYYSPKQGFHGIDSFTLEKTFGSGKQVTDTYTVTVE